MSLGSAPGLGFEPADGSTPGLGFTPGVPMEGTFSEATSTSDRLTVIINKPEGQTLGLDLVPSGGSVVIKAIKQDGAVIEHNAKNPANKVEAKDILKSINGSGPTLDDIVAAVKKASGSLKLELERPKRSPLAAQPKNGFAPGEVPPLLVQLLQRWRDDVTSSDARRDDFFNALQGVLLRYPIVASELAKRTGLQ